MSPDLIVPSFQSLLASLRRIYASFLFFLLSTPRLLQVTGTTGLHTLPSSRYIKIHSHSQFSEKTPKLVTPNRSYSQSTLLPYGFSGHPNHYDHRIHLPFSIRLNIRLPPFGEVYSHSPSIHLAFLSPSPDCLLPPSSLYFRLLRLSSSSRSLSGPYAWIKFVHPSHSNFCDRLQGHPTFIRLLQPSLTFRELQ
jgi:hypothetical protein